MATNQIIPFATGSGAEVVDPVTYAAETYIQQGFQAGVLEAYDLNTVLRQSSFVAAMVAQFIADRQSGAVNDDGNLAKLENQFLAALLSAVEVEGIVYAVDGGTSDVLSATPSPALTAYTPGQVIAVKKNNGVAANATATPTINLNGLGAVTITKSSGMPLYAGDLPQGGIFFAVYDGTYFRHIGLTLSTAALTDQAGQAVFFTAGGTAPAYTGTLTPAPTALAPDMEVLGFFGTANTGAAPTLLLNGIGSALPIRKQGGGSPAAGDITGFVPLILNAAGTAWVVNGLVPSDVLALIQANPNIVKAAANNVTTQVFTTPGAGTYTVPAGVFRVRPKGWGAGGGAGGAASGSPGGAGSGGGAGGYTTISLAVNPGDTISFFIGAPGASGTNASNGGAGGDTTFTYNGTTYTAKGGAGGISANAGIQQNSVSGGTTINGDGNSHAGAPSASGSFSNNGTAAAEGGNGGNATNGGFGGNAGSGNGNAGGSPGGGGGGGGGTPNSVATGGAGGGGQMSFES